MSMLVELATGVLRGDLPSFGAAPDAALCLEIFLERD